jgi:hypothetical protein
VAPPVQAVVRARVEPPVQVARQALAPGQTVPVISAAASATSRLRPKRPKWFVCSKRATASRRSWATLRAKRARAAERLRARVRQAAALVATTAAAKPVPMRTANSPIAAGRVKAQPVGQAGRRFPAARQEEALATEPVARGV